MHIRDAEIASLWDAVKTGPYSVTSLTRIQSAVRFLFLFVYGYFMYKPPTFISVVSDMV